MQELITDIWQVYDMGMPSVYAICITTNGYVKRGKGMAIMGRGTALQAKQRIPGLDVTLGRSLLEHGNTVQELVPGLLSFPVKPVVGTCAKDRLNVVSGMRDRFMPGRVVPGWAMKASVTIIAGSLVELAELQDERQWVRVYLPRPGCGAGELDWETQVKPLCQEYGDWLTVVRWAQMGKGDVRRKL